MALSTLTYHQWSHPTLMALMKGEVIEEQIGIYLHCICLYGLISDSSYIVNILTRGFK